MTFGNSHVVYTLTRCDISQVRMVFSSAPTFSTHSTVMGATAVSAIPSLSAGKSSNGENIRAHVEHLLLKRQG